VAFYNLASHAGAYLDWETDKLLREVDGVFLLRTASLLAPPRTRSMELAVGPYWEVTAAGRTRLARHRVGGVLPFRLVDAVRMGIAAGVDAVDPNRQGECFAVANLGVDLR